MSTFSSRKKDKKMMNNFSRTSEETSLKPFAQIYYPVE